jgi:hypothetical protein
MGLLNINRTRGHIFSRVWPFYEWAVSNLDRSMHRSLWVLVAHSLFIEGSHMTKNTASGFFNRMEWDWTGTRFFFKSHPVEMVRTRIAQTINLTHACFSHLYSPRLKESCWILLMTSRRKIKVLKYPTYWSKNTFVIPAVSRFAAVPVVFLLFSCPLSQQQLIFQGPPLQNCFRCHWRSARIS